MLRLSSGDSSLMPGPNCTQMLNGVVLSGKYAPVTVPYRCLHPQVNKAALTHSQCGRASLPGYRTNCHSAASHRPQGHRIQAGNIMTQFMVPSILEQQPEWCSLYRNCATNRTVWAWNPGRCKRFFFSLKRPDQFWDPPRFPSHA